jgi:hypothetical protein
MDVEVEPPHVHHRPTGHPWLDKILPVCALFISFVSILIAWHHGHVMQALVHQNERLVQANSLPHLQLAGSNTNAAGGREISFSVTNAGIGPAEIRTAEVRVDGRPVGSLRELLAACCGQPPEFKGVVTSTLVGNMIRPGETVPWIRMPVTDANLPAAARLDQARRAGRIQTSLCYCSVFDECWARSDGDRRPRPAGQCPAPDTLYTE